MKHTSLSLRHKQTDTYTSPHMNYDIQMCIHIIHDIYKGILVCFEELAAIQNISDFTRRFHESYVCN